MSKANIFKEENLPEPCKIKGNMEDLTNQTFHELTFLFPYRDDKSNLKWICRCNCGNYIGVFASNVKKGNTSSCGCLKVKNPRARIDLTGQRFGKLVVLGDPQTGDGNKRRGSKWKCQCDCGKIVYKNAADLKRGSTKSCGCLKSELHSTMNDLTNMQFGELTALYTESVSKDGQRIWHCVCSCGNEIDVRAGALRSGKTQSCGCKTSKNNALIEKLLKEKNIQYTKEFSFADLYNKDKKAKLRFDFALYKNNDLIGLIEYQGIQHYEVVPYFGGEEGLKEQQERDYLKRKYCNNNEIPLYYITYKDNTRQKLEEILNGIYS